MHKITRGQMHASKHTITRGQFYASTRGYLRNDKGCKKNQQNDHVIIVFRVFFFLVHACVSTWLYADGCART